MTLSRVEASERFRGLMEKRREAEAKVLELLQHPDVTAEQLVAANKAAVNINRAMRKAVTVLRKRWPRHGESEVLSIHGWNRPEYDKYDERLLDAEKEV